MEKDKVILKHVVTGQVKIFDKHLAKGFIDSPSWYQVDEKGRPVTKKEK